jgi:pectate lyase
MHKGRDKRRPAVIIASIALGAATTFGGTGGAVSGASKQPAFYGAQGYGRFAQGGRGGLIIPVTNLDDAGPGSLRSCIEADGPRNCVFKVAGIIELKEPLVVRHGFLSILGQTAPGGGILISIDKLNDRKKFTPFVIKKTGDVIVRNIRVRPHFPNTIRNVDAFTVEDGEKVYLDHVSGSWATDENINTHANSTDITIANSVFGEGQNKHSKCALLGSDPRIPQNITFWKNACISNRDRNPDDNHYGGSCIEIINNVFFNAKSEWGEIFSQYKGGTPISFVGNYFKAGPSTIGLTYAMNWNDTETADPPHIYQRDNKTWAPKDRTVVLIAPDTEQYIVDKPPCPLAVTEILAVNAAYEEVRKHSGAFPRDSVDERLLTDMGAIGEGGRGKMVTEPGELPKLKPGNVYVDADGDGMADSVEAKFGATPGKNDAWQDSDHNGWSNFDEFMQWLADQRVAGAYPS